MAINLTWPKIAALSALQAAATTALSALGTGSVDLIHADWQNILSLSGGSAVVTLLGLIIAYTLPNIRATGALNVATALAQSPEIAPASAPEPVEPVYVHDAPGARG